MGVGWNVMTSKYEKRREAVFKHLTEERHLDPSRYRFTYDDETANFMLFNLSGKVVGYQQYRPAADKTQDNDPRHSRYFTYVSKFGGLQDAKEGDYKWYQKVWPLNLMFGRSYPWSPRRDRKFFDTAVWGLETYNYRSDVLFVVEGVFDAVRLHNLSLPCVAALSNDVKNLQPWLNATSRHVVVVCDGNKAGRKLAELGHEAVMLPEGKDLGDMTDAEVEQVVKKWTWEWDGKSYE